MKFGKNKTKTNFHITKKKITIKQTTDPTKTIKTTILSYIKQTSRKLKEWLCDYYRLIKLLLSWKWMSRKMLRSVFKKKKKPVKRKSRMLFFSKRLRREDDPIWRYKHFGLCDE